MEQRTQFLGKRTNFFVVGAAGTNAYGNIVLAYHGRKEEITFRLTGSVIDRDSLFFALNGNLMIDEGIVGCRKNKIAGRNFSGMIGGGLPCHAGEHGGQCPGDDRGDYGHLGRSGKQSLDAAAGNVAGAVDYDFLIPHINEQREIRMCFHINPHF